MKKIYILFAVFALCACSVDNEEILSGADSFADLNASVDIEGCESQSHSFGDTGFIEVTNDADFLYVSVVATGNYKLSNVKLHIVDSEASFPTVGQGNLSPGKMKHNESFEPAVNSKTFKLPISEYKGCIYIASQSQFTNGYDSVTNWVGDIAGPSGTWSYLEYCIQTCEPPVPPCEPVNAGSDNIKTVILSEAAAIESWDEVRKLYLSLLDEGVDRTGTFDPPIWDLINDFNARGIGEYSTIYTIGEGDCTDSVLLTMRVVADPAGSE